VSYIAVSPDQLSVALLKQYPIIRVKALYSMSQVSQILTGMAQLRETLGFTTKHYIGKTVFDVGFTYA